MPYCMSRRGSQIGWASTLNSIFLMSFPLRLDVGFARVNIHDGKVEIIAWDECAHVPFFRHIDHPLAEYIVDKLTRLRL